jgi:parallel beta-helix repeat protein
MTKGAWTVLRHEVYGRNAFVLSNCRNVSIHDVNVYTCPGMALVADRSADVTLRRFNVLIRPGTRRLMSVTADATHWGGCTGTVRIEDCVFEGMGDDAVNCKTGLYLTIEEKEDARTVLARHNLKMACFPDPGDELEFVPQATLLPYLTLEVESAELLSRDPQSPQQGLHRVRFTQPLPDSVGVGDLMGNTTRSPVLRVRNCVMRHHRARGMLIQVRDAIVEDCLFEGCTAGGIWALTEVTHFYECISPRNIVIRNNRFIDCTFGGPTGWGVLGVYAIMKGFEHPTQPGIFRDIVIENNVIEGSQNSGIILSGAEDVILRHNTVTGTGSNPTVPEGRSAIHIRASRGIVLEGNRVLPQEQEPGCEASLTIHPDSDPATFSFQGNTGFVAPE